ncbi:Hypothetical protein FKW44_001864 [Caligus rogercresseyi]|uniref:Uncharacterized protein n=1 Tax=Caligus rogercresseyi TaxID=217165 RepID=A0A7T8KJK0_CALRO|nr:Hypothetical protein FKW44_001864 [Caligus rogercresseyi]
MTRLILDPWNTKNVAETLLIMSKAWKGFTGSILKRAKDWVSVSKHRVLVSIEIKPIVFRPT